MGNYVEGFYHLVWATKGRAPYITQTVEVVLHDYIRNECETLKITVYAVNGMADHVHLACTLPVSVSVSECVRKIKGSSSWHINQQAKKRGDLQMCLYWQENYGVLTFARHDLSRITHYIDEQKQHHTTGSLHSRLERCTDSDTASSAPQGLSSV